MDTSLDYEVAESGRYLLDAMLRCRLLDHENQVLGEWHFRPIRG
jgi:hypothetical protein